MSECYRLTKYIQPFLVGLNFINLRTILVFRGSYLSNVEPGVAEKKVPFRSKTGTDDGNRFKFFLRDTLRRPGYFTKRNLSLSVRWRKTATVFVKTMVSVKNFLRAVSEFSRPEKKILGDMFEFVYHMLPSILDGCDAFLRKFSKFLAKKEPRFNKTTPTYGTHMVLEKKSLKKCPSSIINQEKKMIFP